MQRAVRPPRLRRLVRSRAALPRRRNYGPQPPPAELTLRAPVWAGRFVPSDDPKFTATSPEKEMAVVAGKDTRKIECEFLITVVPILDHEGPLQTAFPIENRLTGQAGPPQR